jgi:hypothetical protein
MRAFGRRLQRFCRSRRCRPHLRMCTEGLCTIGGMAIGFWLTTSIICNQLQERKHIHRRNGHHGSSSGSGSKRTKRPTPIPTPNNLCTSLPNPSTARRNNIFIFRAQGDSSSFSPITGLYLEGLPMKPMFLTINPATLVRATISDRGQIQDLLSVCRQNVALLYRRS